MEKLEKGDQDVLRLMCQGIRDIEICRQLRISETALARSVQRIEERSSYESDNAGRLYERALRLRTERLNEALSSRLHALMDILAQAVLVVDGRTGRIKEFNNVASSLFGYSPKELLKMTVEDLVEESVREIHPTYRIGFLANVRKREMGYHPPIFGVCKNGAKVEMAIALTATNADDDVMVVCTVRPYDRLSAAEAVHREGH